MRMKKIGLRELLFYRKVPGIKDGMCKYRQENQTVKHILLECRLFALQGQNLWAEEGKRAQNEGGRCLDIQCILTDGLCAQKDTLFIKRTGLTGRSMAPLTERN